jgi:hypothetical protein
MLIELVIALLSPITQIILDEVKKCKERNSPEKRQLKSDIEDILKKYEFYLKESKKRLKSNKIKPKKVSYFAVMGAKMKMRKDVKKDNSDSKISDILIQGLVMGVIDINKRIDNYKKEVDNDLISFCNNLLVFQQESIDKLKVYL